MNLGAAVRRVRQVRGLDQQQLAEKAGIARSHLSRIETGVNKPSLDVLLAIASSLSVPLTILILFAENDPALYNFQPLAWAEVFRRVETDNELRPAARPQ